MRFSEGESARVLFVNIVGQHAADLSRRILPVDAGQEYREVPHVDGVFLPEMDFKLGLGDVGALEMRPGPVVFSIHHRHHFFAELFV